MPKTRSRLAAVIVVLGAAGFDPSAVVRAQGVVTELGLSGGRMTDERGVRSDAASLGARLLASPNGLVAFSLAGNASRLDNTAWQLGGTTAMSARTPEVAHLALSVAGAASATRASYGATFLTGEATPALEARFGAVTLYGGGHVASGRTTVDAQPNAAVPVVLTSRTRTLRAPVYGAVWSLALDESVPLSLAYREEPARVEGATITDRSADATLAVARLTLGASVGRRSVAGTRTPFWTGSAGVQITPAMSLQAVGGKYPSSLLTGAAAGTFVSIGLQFSTGGAARGARLPRPRGVESAPRGVVRLSIRAPSATRVEVAGDWNGWTPVAARRASNGVWYADLALPPGDYRYAFRLDGSEWRVPEGAVASDDGFGGKTAYVSVARRSTSISRTNFQEEK
ncbi:MAG: hypothetical protein HYV19_03515 [Gemmatimonadetes bacterium]|nr:hypothetical protein [Gemmatimonadota bacterium]